MFSVEQILELHLFSVENLLENDQKIPQKENIATLL